MDRVSVPAFGTSTLNGLINNAAALLAYEEGHKSSNTERQNFHLTELLSYIAALQDKL
jgi:hypothetical protein